MTECCHKTVLVRCEGCPYERGVRDITLPCGSVRHNVGSDNLSDEDRESMALTNEQVAALNECQWPVYDEAKGG